MHGKYLDGGKDKRSNQHKKLHHLSLLPAISFVPGNDLNDLVIL